MLGQAPESRSAEPQTSRTATALPILYFDGVCGLCNRFVNFTLARDRSAAMRFAPLQGETARERLPAQDVDDLSSVVFEDKTGRYRRSSAVVRVLWQLGGAWKVAGGLLWLIPRPVRDLGYRIVARNRYRIFGKKDACRLPTPAERDRFLP